MLQPTDSSSTSALPTPVTNATLSTLVTRAQMGDCYAFDALFELYYVKICKYLTRLVGNIDIAYDLAQDVFLSAWQALPDMPPELHFSAWLYKIAMNKVYAHWRRGRTVSMVSWEAGEVAFDEQAGVTEFEESIAAMDLTAKVLQQIPKSYRSCLLLQCIEGFSIKEIAKILNMNEKTVSVYISRARETFRREYKCLLLEADQVKGGR